MMKNNRLGALGSVAVILLLMILAIGVLFVEGKNDGDVTFEALKSSDGQGTVTFLILGRDSAAGLCDVIMLASMDFSKGEANVMQIPRDTYFNYTQNDYKKINGAVNSLASSAAFADKLANALGINIDYYVSFGLDTVEKMIDAMSGIEVDVPFNMDYDDEDQGLSIHLEAGRQNLNGKTAVQFLRYRSGYLTGDLGRIDAQKLFINAFAKKVAEQKNPIVLYNLVKIICTGADTNLKEQDLMSIALKCSKSKMDKTYYMTAPGEAVQSNISGAWYYIISKESLAELLSDRFNAAEGENGFDIENKFVDKRIKPFYDIYNKRCEYMIYSADDIENNLITIN